MYTWKAKKTQYKLMIISFFSFFFTHKVHKLPLGHPLSVRKNLQGFAIVTEDESSVFTCDPFFFFLLEKIEFDTDIYI